MVPPRISPSSSTLRTPTGVFLTMFLSREPNLLGIVLEKMKGIEIGRRENNSSVFFKEDEDFERSCSF